MYELDTGNCAEDFSEMKSSWIHDNQSGEVLSRPFLARFVSVHAAVNPFSGFTAAAILEATNARSHSRQESFRVQNTLLVLTVSRHW